MSVSKSRDTNSLLLSERKSFLRFISLYALLVVLLLGVAGYLYFETQEKLAFSAYRIKMIEYATDQTKRLKTLHNHFPQENVYPRDSRYNSAIYDLEYAKIFSTLKEPKVNLEEEIYKTGDRIHYIKILDNYYLGAKYLIIELPEDKEWISNTLSNIALYGFGALVLLLALGFYLAKLFVRPMRNSIMLLDQFIKDTTHELNTPLSAILANIETMNTDSMEAANLKKLNRINIAARTVSTLYEDLKFATLESGKETAPDRVNMKEIIESRLEYFSIIMESKKIKLKKSLSESFIVADKSLMERVVDNLISNAIKYNKRGGEISVVLEQGRLEIMDSGVGIPADRLSMVFDRYARFNDSEGGFGIGLSIVKRIADRYGIEIDIKSQEGKWTKVVLKWQI